jgi:hypothetical protein
VGSQIGHPNPPLQISAKEEKESENSILERRTACCALHCRFAMLTVLLYGCASRPTLRRLATVVLAPSRAEYGISETEPEIIACYELYSPGPARDCGTWVFKNCLNGIVSMNPEALCDKMYPCLQVGGDRRTVRVEVGLFKISD